ncbi:endogenous retrovirus group K member 9 Gag polyprotein-like isoform X2 [Pseudorca crassidens]|uniref:endogenous retrovirus group K member 9 Gag polyprotein-like isoform X2 n=1 Tax=Pseudorca crassidens TaxID=82174 RepID=UPI00352E2E4A
MINFRMDMSVEYNPHDFKIFKMLKEAIKAYGMHSNYVQGLLSGYASKNILIPQDWEALARTVLEPGQYMQFKTWWKEEAENMARTNVARNPPGPLLDELIGAGAFSNVQAQAQFDDLRIIQIRMCCLRAWLRVEPPGKTAQSFTKLMQGPGEPYTDFLSRLHAAIQRAVAQTDVQDLLLQSLAFENANPECQKALRPLRAVNAPLEEYIKACHDIGSPTYANLLAAAITGGLKDNRTKCYNCGKYGHMRRDCRKGQGQISKQVKNEQPPGMSSVW